MKYDAPRTAIMFYSNETKLFRVRNKALWARRLEPSYLKGFVSVLEYEDVVMISEQGAEHVQHNRAQNDCQKWFRERCALPLNLQISQPKIILHVDEHELTMIGEIKWKTRNRETMLTI